MVSVAIVVAFLQVILLLFVLFGAISSPTNLTGEAAIDTTKMFSVVAASAEGIYIFGCAIALFKRRAWGAFGLVADSALNIPAKSFQFGAGSMLGSLIFVGIYWAGTSALLRSRHTRPLFRELKWHAIVRYGLLLYAGWQGVSFIFGLTGWNKDAAAIPFFWALDLIWGLAVLALSAKYDTKWSFETVMSVSIVAQLFSLIDVPFHVGYGGMTWEIAFLSWLVRGFFLLAAAVLAWGAATALPLPIMQPGEAASNILAFKLRHYNHTQVMSDVRRLLVVIGMLHIGAGYYLFTGGELRQFTEEEALSFALMGMVYMTAALLKSFWFRFICIVLWTCDLLYTSVVLNPKVSPSIFIPIGAYFAYEMWSRRKQIIAAKAAVEQNALEKPSGSADQSLSA
jgi:hypothetical protein